MSIPNPDVATADRNLRFGLLALQMDFIGRADLLEALHVWVVDKAKPLGQILSERGNLSPDLRPLLEALVERHLQAHANDPQRSLAALVLASLLGHHLEAIGDPDLQASLSLLPRAEKESEATTSYTVPDDGAGPRFRILRPHARGGLGEVFVATDAELHREVALKQIRPEHAGDAQSRGRFLLEAEITGGLEHPGIVPVYGLGQYPDGRPYYAMRFVKGDNLKEAIGRFHQRETPSESAPREQANTLSERNLAFRDLLGRFIDVCNAVAYAHSRGILHRDLKPGNVMLGKYGETLVVDWGLAKPVDKPENLSDTSEPALRPASAESSSFATQTGSALGTPAYMSPEQAAGRADLLGPASDIYSLGATLYAVLTGKAPFAGDMAAIIQQVQQGDFRPPRRVYAEVPAALEAICLKAMARNPAARYSSALELAADVEHWLADEPVSAFKEPVSVKLGRWVRRHKARVSAAAAAVLVGLLALGAGLVWYQGEQARQAQERARREAESAAQTKYRTREVTAALGQAEQGWHKLQQQLADPLRVHELLSDIGDWERQVTLARAAWQQAKKLAGPGDAPLEPALLNRLDQLDRQLKAAEDDYELARQLDVIRLEAVTPPVTLKAFPTVLSRQLDVSRLEADPPVEGKLDLRKAGPKYAQLFARAGYPVQAEPEKAVGLRIQQSAIRFALVAALDHWAEVASEQQLLTRLLAVTRAADPDPWRDRFRDETVWKDLRVLEQLANTVDLGRQSPQVLATLARRLHSAKGQALPLLRQALLHYPRDFWLHFHLGNVVHDPVEQVGCYRTALAIRPQSSSTLNNPNYALAHYNLGVAFHDKKDLDGALASWQKARDLDPNFAPTHNNLGSALHSRRKPVDAIACFRKAIALDPHSALFHINLGVALFDHKELDEAIACYERAIALDPQLSRAHYYLALALHGKKDLVRAATHFREATQLNPNYAEAHWNLGEVLRLQGQFVEALKALRQGHQLGFGKPGWSFDSAGMIAKCEELLALDRLLPDVLAGKAQPRDGAERLALARLCYRYKKLHATAARFSAEAFAAETRLADLFPNRYNAGCAAALAGTGQGKDAANLDENTRARLRHQALDWLRAELAALGKAITAGPKAAAVVRKRLARWQHDPDLASVREPGQLAQLSDGERQAWQQFWADVAALLQD